MNIMDDIRLNLVIDANRAMINYDGDERFYMKWIEVVPDEAEIEDLQAIAQDPNQYWDVLNLFYDLIEEIAKEDDQYAEWLKDYNIPVELDFED